MDIMVGFDPARLHWSGVDLQHVTKHEDYEDVLHNYARIKELGIRTIRDGLPINKDPYYRIDAAYQSGLSAIWDVVHFDPANYIDTYKHISKIIELISTYYKNQAFKVCPWVEPSLAPVLARSTVHTALITFEAIVHNLRSINTNIYVLCCDPINGEGEHQYTATDWLVERNLVSCIGINYYPHDATALLSTVLIETHKRYKLPLMVSETGWHNGHPGQCERQPWCHSKAQWLQHVLDECAVAERAGVVLQGVCLYPASETPSWDGTTDVWDNGLLRLDGTYDSSLEQLLRQRL